MREVDAKLNAQIPKRVEAVARRPALGGRGAAQQALDVSADTTRMEMVLGDHRVKLGDFVRKVQSDEDAQRVHVVLHHAVVAKAGEHVHGNAAFLMLDRAFGEDGVDRWLGSIEVAPKPPAVRCRPRS